MAYEAFQVVRVPFPFTDRQTTRNRPALVLSDRERFNDASGQAVMAMITTATRSRWPLDTEIVDLSSAGLPQASKVRFKLFTLDDRVVRGALGRLGAADEIAVRRALASLLPNELARRATKEAAHPSVDIRPGSRREHSPDDAG